MSRRNADLDPASPPIPVGLCCVCGLLLEHPDRVCHICCRPACGEHFIVMKALCAKCAEAGVQQPSLPLEFVEEVAGEDLPLEIRERGHHLVLVPAGPFIMGREDDFGDEGPEHEVRLDAFYIGKYPVTNAQYQQFAQWTRRGLPTHLRPDQRGYDEFAGGHEPVVQVTYSDAVAFCYWLSRLTGEWYHLPTEAQWEKAARGTDGRKYPWGDEEPRSHLCNCDNELETGRTTDVDRYLQGASPYGCLGMAGNVQEMCADSYQWGYYKVSPLNNPPGPSRGRQRVVRGGCYLSPPEMCRSFARLERYCRASWSVVGFRVARAVRARA